MQTLGKIKGTLTKCTGPEKGFFLFCSVLGHSLLSLIGLANLLSIQVLLFDLSYTNSLYSSSSKILVSQMACSFPLLFSIQIKSIMSIFENVGFRSRIFKKYLDAIFVLCTTEQTKSPTTQTLMWSHLTSRN